MAGRIAYFLIAGAAVVGGMFYQGDIDLDFTGAEQEARALLDGDDAAIDRTVDRTIDRNVDRIIEREVSERVIRVEDRQSVETNPAAKRALADAVAELVRAEGSLVTARIDDETPAAVIKQAEQRRDVARQAVDRLADDAKAGARGDRDALRQNIRDGVREGVRDAVRS